MSELNPEQKEYYVDIANKHAIFLTEKVFKPAFTMGFIHGVKHGRKDLADELKAKHNLDISKLKLKEKLNRQFKLELRQRGHKKK